MTLFIAIAVLTTAGITAKLIYIWSTDRIVKAVRESSDPAEIVRLQTLRQRNQRW
jgi:hypothetical protein